MTTAQIYMSKVRRGLLGVALLLAAAHSVHADSYPSKPIKMIVPAGTGTGSDLAARYFSVGLGALLNTPVIVENRLGAGGVIGTEAVAKAAPDGYTLLLTFASHYINQWIMPTTVDAVRDFEPIAGLNISALVLVTAPTSPYKSLQDLLSAAKRTPGGLSYASAGAGGVTHMAGALLNSMAHVDLHHIPYKAAGQVPIDASAGQVDVAFVGITAALPLIRAGRLRALAVTTRSRSLHLPDTPTMSEAGLPGYEMSSKIVVLAPRGTSPEIVSKLSSAFIRLASSNEFKEFCRLQGCEVDVRDSATVKAAAPEELGRWKQLVELTKPASN